MLIKELRKITGLSQAAFAKKFHIPVGTLSHWEQGVRTPPDYVVYMLSRIIYMEREQYQKQNVASLEKLSGIWFCNFEFIEVHSTPINKRPRFFFYINSPTLCFSLLTLVRRTHRSSFIPCHYCFVIGFIFGCRRPAFTTLYSEKSLNAATFNFNSARQPWCLSSTKRTRLIL